MALACPVDLDSLKLRREVQEMYARVASTPDGSFHFHRGPEYAAGWLGYDASEDLLGLDLARHVYRHAEERDQTFRRSVGSTRIVEVEVEWLRRDGSPIWVHVSIRPVVDGAPRLSRAVA